MSLLGLMMILFLFFSSRFGAGILKEEADKYLRSFTGASLIFNCVYGCYNLNQYLMSEDNIISLGLGTKIIFFRSDTISSVYIVGCGLLVGCHTFSKFVHFECCSVVIMKC